MDGAAAVRRKAYDRGGMTGSVATVATAPDGFVLHDEAALRQIAYADDE